MDIGLPRCDVFCASLPLLETRELGMKIETVGDAAVIAMAVLDVVAGVAYGWCGRWGSCVYWLAVGVVTVAAGFGIRKYG